MGIWLDKRIETVESMLAVSAADGVFVPVNPVLKPAQVRHVLADCDVRVLVTTASRVGAAVPEIGSLPALEHLVVVGEPVAGDGREPPTAYAAWRYADLAAAAPGGPPRGRPASTPTWRRSSTPPAAPAARRASCSATAT